jgi:hypothetical protein
VTKIRYLTDFRLARLLIVDAVSVLGMLHGVIVGDVTDVSGSTLATSSTSAWSNNPRTESTEKKN